MMSFRYISLVFAAIVLWFCWACSTVGNDEKVVITIDSLLAQADSLFDASESDEALSLQIKAYQYATNEIQRACVQVDIAHTHYFMGQIDLATNMLEQSIKTFNKTEKLSEHQLRYKMQALMLYADILRSLGKSYESLQYYKDAAALSTLFDDQHSYVACRLAIGRQLGDDGNFPAALDMCREILSHCTDEEMDIDRFSVLCEIHRLFTLMGDYDEANVYLNEMRKMSNDDMMLFVSDMSEMYQYLHNPFFDMTNAGDCVARLKSDINITGMSECYGLNAFGMLAEYYIITGDYKSAKICVDSYLNVANNDRLNVGNAFFLLSEAELLIHYNKLDSAWSILSRNDMVNICHDVVRLTARYDSVLGLYYCNKGDYESEYRTVVHMSEVSDSLQLAMLNHNLAYRNMVHQRDTTILSNAIKINQKQSKLEALIFWQAVWVIIIIITILVAIIIALNVVVEMIKEREREIYQQNLHLQHEVVRRTSILQTQKLELERTNERLNREIKYAGRIQRDILSSESVLNSPLLRGHFVYYKPCQNISGDFYWFYAIGDRQFVLCADATGHGIPGAFVSMVCSAILNDMVSTSEMSAAELIQTLDIRLRSILRNNSNALGSDSVDASLVCINNKTGVVSMALARHKARIVRANGQMEYVTGVKRSIGDIDEIFLSRPFVETECTFEKGDILYLTTDGLESQFGGIDGRKLKTYRMDDMFRLMSICEIGEQRQYLDKFFKNWKGECEQTDDVLVIGLAF